MSNHFSMGAINKTTNNYEYPKIANKINKYKCPFCEKDVIFRNGKIKQPHFAHYKSDNPCSYYEKPNETQIHKDSIDETSVSTSLTHNYCRAFLGDRCIKKTTNNEVFKKYSLVVAINNKKCISSELYQNGAVNAERFNEFLKNICSKVKGKLFVLDNGQIHKKESTKQIIKESGNYLVYTCPYHPRLNSIEQFFNQMKHYIKLDKPNTFTTLDGSVKSSIDKIKPTNYENYFIYAYNKDYYKNKLNNKKYTRRRTLKIYKN